MRRVRIDNGAFHRVARVAATVTVLLGCSVLLGWALNIGVLKTVVPHTLAMKANTALSFVLTGLSLTFQIEPYPSRRRLTAARGCALLAASIGLLTLLEYLFEVDFGVDQLLLADAPDARATFPPGRMAPNTALSVLLVGAALSLLDAGSRRLQAAAHALAVVTLLAGFGAFVGYAYNATALAGVMGYTLMAVPTAGGLVVLSTGVLACRPHRGLMAIVAQDNLAGSSLRRLLPVVVVVPFAVGWMQLRGESAGLYGKEFGVSLMVTMTTVVLLSVVLWNAHVSAFETREQALRDQRASDEHLRPLLDGKDGTEVPVEIGLTPMETPEGGFVATSIVDISERKRTDGERGQLLGELRALTKDLERRVDARTKDLAAAHETLSRSESRFRALFDDSPISLWEQDFSDAVAYLRQLGADDAADLRARVIADPDVVATAAGKVKILAVNQASLKIFEAASETELSQSLPQIFRSLQFATFRDELLAFLDGKTFFEAETTTYTLKGNRNNISLRLSVLPGHEKTWSKVVVSIFDMTAHKEAEDKIRESLREKEVLLREIHHRVKNNLQVISSLLNLQARHLRDPAARTIFAQSQNRVQAIALVHEKLYQSRDLSRIQFDEYVQTLVSNLCHSLGAAERDISPSVEVGGITLAVDVAIPCGLIINELVTNSLKHAFPNRRGGCIQILLRRSGSDRLELIVQDDGVGLPSGLDPRQTPSLGLDLVFTFAEQLGATVDVRRHPGTAYSFVFPQNG
jgi:two-component system, sensor histidine kinase PdtaS